MRCLRTLVLFDKGNISSSESWRSVYEGYSRSIQRIDFPEGSGALTLRRKRRLNSGQFERNGVKYLQSRFLKNMRDDEGWQPEGVVELARDRHQPPLKLYPEGIDFIEPIASDFGGFDLYLRSDDGFRVAIEWETGNISSSHRSMNKLSISIKAGLVDAGVLIVPSRAFYEHLTDRVGNIGELSGYLEMWAGLYPYEAYLNPTPCVSFGLAPYFWDVTVSGL